MNYKFDLPIDISIPLKFNGPQPNAYGVAPAVSEPVRAGSLVGDTRQGGSVNFESYTFIPHCNGTHTECVGHITNERISVRDCLNDVVMPALLVSVEPEILSEPSASAGGQVAGDQVISADLLRPLLPERRTDSNSEALIIRTLPNSDEKLTAEYGEANIPAYLTTDAMELIIESGFTHLLVDLPSIDRIFDQGKLVNHRIFWNVEEGSFETNTRTRMGSTITELIYVPNEISDGDYLLNLQIAPFESDCAPSRPILLCQTSRPL